MSNMSYCRFRNTKTDLEDCLYAIEDAGDVDSMRSSLEASNDNEEAQALDNLVHICKKIVELSEDA